MCNGSIGVFIPCQGNTGLTGSGTAGQTGLAATGLTGLGTTGQTGLGSTGLTGLGTSGTDPSGLSSSSGLTGTNPLGSTGSIFGQNPSSSTGGLTGQGGSQDSTSQMMQLLQMIVQLLQGVLGGNSSGSAAGSPCSSTPSSTGGSSPSSSGGSGTSPCSSGGSSGSSPTSTCSGSSNPTSTGGCSSSPVSTGGSSGSSGSNSNLAQGEQIAKQYLQSTGNTGELNALNSANIQGGSLQAGAGGLTNGNNVTISNTELANDSPTQVASLLVHEGTHVEQNKQHGNTADTVGDETQAYTNQNAFNKSHGLSTINIGSTLKSSLYKGIKK